VLTAFADGGDNSAHEFSAIESRLSDIKS